MPGSMAGEGELDKIIERSANLQSYRRVEARSYGDRERDDDDYEHYERYPGRRRKRRSFLDDLFDFG
jgi:Zn-finger nucleic acid-binding protein